ncbi:MULTISPECIES: DUF7002 family protein [unclassified Yoonia]|uniref:DUF7002 family protein n=1 Tax=unclassified Yoonia TaxID=2629118 RepID=UPI002AFEC5F2|nr:MULTISPECIES: hypothetical protein [unclassified Yoonia]
MTLRDDFIRAVGPRLLHCTARSNVDGIRRNGLLPPDHLADRASRDAAALVLRDTRVILRLPDNTTAQLNHQLPILHGLAAANRVIDGHDAASWAQQLDRRVFFWPERKGGAFVDSVTRDTDTALIWFDSGRFFDVLSAHIWLSPLNSGNFTQGGAHARRGDWLYCRATDGIPAFRHNRQARGLIAGTDTVKEVSLTCSLAPDVFVSLDPDIR